MESQVTCGYCYRFFLHSMSTQYEKSQSRSIFGCEFIFYAVTQVKNNKVQGINEWIKNKSFPLENSFDLNFHMRFVRRLQVFQVFFPYFPITVPPTGLACLLHCFFFFFPGCSLLTNDFRHAAVFTGVNISKSKNERKYGQPFTAVHRLDTKSSLSSSDGLFFFVHMSPGLCV